MISRFNPLSRMNRREKIKAYLIWSPLFLALMSLLVFNNCATYTFHADDRVGRDVPVASSEDIRSVYWELAGCHGPLLKTAQDRCDVLKESVPAQLQKAGYSLASSKENADLRISVNAAFFSKKYGDEDFFLFVIPTGSCFFCNFDGRPTAHYINALKVRVTYQTDLQRIGKTYRLYDQYSNGIFSLSTDFGSFVLDDIQDIKKK